MPEIVEFTPSEFLVAANQTLDYAYSNITLVGEVASFKINQGRWVFFDIKDEGSTISCFMTLFQLRMPIEDGMKIRVRGVPKLTKWGKFSFTVNSISLVGEGNIKKAYEILKKKLGDEGLFDSRKKRLLPEYITKLGIISSTGAAGYADFIKIVNSRWGGMEIKVAHTQVQGMDAPDQIIRAIHFFNEYEDVEVIAILRGGGSADDLSCFNDEKLVRAIVGSKIPIVTGIGHEIDESLADLAADVRASTPSNAAEMLTKDRKAIKKQVKIMTENIGSFIISKIFEEERIGKGKILDVKELMGIKINEAIRNLGSYIRMLESVNPENVLKRGYAIVRGDIDTGNVVKITTFRKNIKAVVKEVYERQ